MAAATEIELYKQLQGDPSKADMAMQYADQGWSVFPLRPGTKLPMTEHGFKDATTGRHMIREWWKKEPDANIGLATGSVSGIVALDFDVKNGQQGRETFGEMQKVHQLKTLTSKTPSGGIHLLFQYSGDDISNRAGILPGLDIRGDGGYIVAPGSSTDEGSYQWKNQTAMAPLPDSLHTLLCQKKLNGESKPFDRSSILDGVPEGERDEKIFKYACSLQSRGSTRAEAELLVTQTAERCKPPFDINAALEKVARVYDKYEVINFSGFSDTDMANGERFASLYRKSVFYTPERGWMIWDGKRWRVDEGNQIMRLAKLTAKKIFSELEVAASSDQKELFRWARQSQSKDRLKAMVELAISEPGIIASLTDFDADPMLLNVNNGTIDLKTGELKPHDPEQKLSMIVPVDYIPGALCPLWLSFLSRIMDQDDEMIDFLQRAMGYTLTGNVGEQCLFFTHGTGSNGKSVFLEVLLLLLGEYGSNTRAETIMQKSYSGIPNDIARLVHTRFVGISETEHGQKMAESLIKDLTGGDTVTARFLRKEFFDFKPEFKLWIRGNHKPNVRGTDDGIWRRIHLIPFAVQIPEADRDGSLPDKLKKELPGILRWAVEGAQIWAESGLQVPGKVKSATSEYRDEMDRLADFIAEKCVVFGSCSGFAGNLYKAYQGWCEESGERAMSQTVFGLALGERGYAKKTVSGRRKYMGIGLDAHNEESMTCSKSGEG